MPSMNIYVSDELKARMDACGKDVNWSEVVRPCIRSAVAVSMQRKEPNMANAIERLRASKAERLNNLKAQAEAAGRQWASDHAEYEDLAKLSELQRVLATNHVDIDNSQVRAAIGEEMTADDFNEALGLTELRSDQVDEYLAHFVDAAVDFYDEVADQL